MDTARGHKLLGRRDVSIPVKYGLTLEVERNYSSASWHQSNFDGETMFGPSWNCPYQMELGVYTDPIVLQDVYYMVSSSGNFVHFIYDRTEYDANIGGNAEVYESFLIQGQPMELRFASSSPSEYYVTNVNRRQYIFGTNMKLAAIEADAYTPIEERISFEYDTNGRLWKVLAPSGDDRYLQFQYHTTTGLTNQVQKVMLKTATTSYDLVEYVYNSTGLLAEVSWNQNADYAEIYKYGSFNGTSLTPVTGYPKLLGQYGYRVGTTEYLTNGYQYGSLDFGGGDLQRVEKTFSYDPNTSSWATALEIEYTDWYHNDVIKPNGTSTPPRRKQTLAWSHDRTQVTFDDLSSGTHMPSGRSVPPDSSTYSTLGVAFRTTVEDYQFNPTSMLFDRLIGSRELDLDNTSHLDRFRLLSTSSYHGDNPSTSEMKTVYTYDTSFTARIATTTSPTGEQTTYNYYKVPLSLGGQTGSFGRLTSISAGGLTSSMTYNSSGLVATSTNPWGETTTYTYNSRGERTSVLYPDGNEVTYTYNDFGMVKTITDEHLSTTTAYTYSNEFSTSDSRFAIPPRIVSVEDDQSNITSYVYDERSNLITIVDPNLNTSGMTYDVHGRMITRANAEGEVEKFVYDLYDNLVKYIDGRNSSLTPPAQKYTEYQYDEFNRIRKEIDPDGYAKEYAYADESGSGGCGCSGGATASSVARVKQEDGKYVHFAYDLAGRLTKVWYSNNATLTSGEVSSPQITYTYDLSSRVLSITDTRLTLAGNQAYSFTYDTGSAGDTGRLEKITHPEGYVQEYVFQDNNTLPHYRKLIAYRDVDGNVTKYAYDSLERLQTLTDTYGGNTSYTYATSSDTTYPLGGIKQTSYGNGAKNVYTYDILKRLDKVEYQNASSTVFDYVDLAYDPAGIITSKSRGDNTGLIQKTVYDYDDAYRLTMEEYQNASLTAKSRRSYTYDDAGNRASMTQWNDASVNLSTTYAYGNRNQITSNTGYYRGGINSTGNMTYGWDAKGNMTSRTGSVYTWNADNRLVEIITDGLDPKLPIAIVRYAYDQAGRRLIKYVNNGQRTRYFFNGLTEEIKKVSVGTHADTSFAYTPKLTSVGDPAWNQAVSTAWDADRASQVTVASGEVSHGANYWSSGDGWNIENRRTFSVWLKSSVDEGRLCISMKMTDGTRLLLAYDSRTGSGYTSGSEGFIPLGGTSQDYSNGAWVRVERDLQADINARFPGKTLQKVTGIYIWTGPGTPVPALYLDDLAFSNSLTVEHNTLGGGVIGHILRNRTINPTTLVATDRWFHYDQVGSVMSVSNGSGTLVTKVDQDAFGNVMASWQTGLWTDTYAARAGWHHNTKEFDADAGMVYMYQRWYQPEVGGFPSKAPFEQWLEHPYTAFAQNPGSIVDPEGELGVLITIATVIAIGVAVVVALNATFEKAEECAKIRSNFETKCLSGNWIPPCDELVSAYKDCVPEACDLAIEAAKTAKLTSADPSPRPGR